jgi:hypothetical protein
MTALERAATIVIDRPILSSEEMLHKDYNRKCSVKDMVVMSLKRLVTKTSRLAIKRQS